MLFFCVFSVETTSGRLLRLDIQSDSKARSNRWQCQQWCTLNSMTLSFLFKLLYFIVIIIMIYWWGTFLSFQWQRCILNKKYYLHTLKLVWAFGIDEPPYSRFEHVVTNALKPNKDRLSRYLIVASRDWSGRPCRADAFSFVRTPSQNKKLDFESKCLSSKNLSICTKQWISQKYSAWLFLLSFFQLLSFVANASALKLRILHLGRGDILVELLYQLQTILKFSNRK